MVIRAAKEHPGYSEFDRARFLDELAAELSLREIAPELFTPLHFAA
jgi:hypothetical protein